MRVFMKYGIVIFALFLVGCGIDFESMYEVKRLRVLAVEADPPEVEPGEGTEISVLWADPEGDGRTVEFVWWVCAGYAYGANLELCEPLMPPLLTTSDEGGDRLSIPGTPPELLEMVELPDGMESFPVSVVGLLCADGELPSDKKLGKPETVDHIKQFCKGGESEAFMIEVDVTLIEDEKKRDKNMQENPKIDRLEYKKEPLTPIGDDLEETTVRCKEKEGCGLTVKLNLYMAEGSEQTYDVEKYGKTEEKTETLFVSWYTTNGEFADGDLSLVEDDAKDIYGPFLVEWEPEEPGHHIVYAVAHDTRGGTSYQAYAFEVLPAK